MKSSLLYVCLVLGCFGCGKTASTSPGYPFSGTVTAYSPIAVTKTSSKKVFVHFMPWFSTPATTPYGTWGQHWTMTNQTPPAHIASYYYPSIGPYASSDTTVIDYQLLLMKLSGIDGIFIDWPGTLAVNDFAWNVANTNAVVSRLSKAGLKYAIVYEDQNLTNITPPVNLTNEIAQARTDMSYIQTHYFSDPNYVQESGNPLLLVFGPELFHSAADWDSTFSVLSPKPSFFTLLNQSSQAGTNAIGEFAWVDQHNITDLDNFYNNGYSGIKMAAAYPGFNSFYTAGGWPNTTPWTIPYTNGSTTTFAQTLSLALTQPGNYIQLVTWNDYGEGTMIEPTTQYQYSFLTTLQQQLGVQSLSLSDLQAVGKLYTARHTNSVTGYNPANLNELDQVYYDIASLQMDSAKALLTNF